MKTALRRIKIYFRKCCAYMGVHGLQYCGRTLFERKSSCLIRLQHAQELIYEYIYQAPEYCARTSIHGFQYFGESKRTLLERLLWILLFLMSLIVCSYTIYEVYQKWDGSPVIVNFANKGTPIYEIPFPAVTICPESKFQQDKFNYTEVLQKVEAGEELNLTEATYFEYFSPICNYFPKNYNTQDANISFTDGFFDAIDYLKPELDFTDCSLLEYHLEDCERFFRPIITDEGICYTFNMLDREYIYRDNVRHYKDYHQSDESIDAPAWSLQNGYTPEAKLEAYPFRAYLSGAINGLSINILTPHVDLDYACKDALQGYRVLLHTPMTIPRPKLKYFRVPLDQIVVGAVSPIVITTSNRVKSYSPKKRGCYFSTEKQLKYFQNYTSSNCHLECLTNYTLHFCGCVNFYMPRENGTDICGVAKRECMHTAEEYMKLQHLVNKLGTESDDLVKDTDSDCGCLAVCSDLTYEVETSQNDWEWQKLLESRPDLPRVSNKSHFSSLTLFFKNDNFIASERNELYGPMDFLANIGGLLGLFTGLSILSLCEILYFLSIRIVCNLRLYSRLSIENSNPV